MNRWDHGWRLMLRVALALLAVLFFLFPSTGWRRSR
jgi:hypothetical protein